MKDRPDTRVECWICAAVYAPQQPCVGCLIGLDKVSGLGVIQMMNQLEIDLEWRAQVQAVYRLAGFPQTAHYLLNGGAGAQAEEP